MGLLSMFAKAGIAKKLVDEARKPQNQQKLKDAVAKVRGQGGQGGQGDQGDPDGPGGPGGAGSHGGGAPRP